MVVVVVASLKHERSLPTPPTGAAPSLSMALVLRIKFPATYPVIYKTLRLDSSLTVREAINFVNETLRVQVEGDIGLWIPSEKRWLDDDKPLNSFEGLQDLVCFICQLNFLV